jgi:hypothetical protein
MKARIILTACSAAVLATGSLFCVSKAAESDQKKPVVASVSSLNERIVESGAYLTIELSRELSDKIDAAMAHIEQNPTNAPKYQWRKNDNDIAGQTGNKLTFKSITHDDAGKYTVVVRGPIAEESAPLYVSVRTRITGSQGDALTVPLTSFSTPQSGTQICGGNNFVRWKSYTLYGRNVPNQNPDFANPGFNNLKVNTCSNLNSSVHTAIVVKNLNNGAQVTCNRQHNDHAHSCEASNPNPQVSSIESISLNAEIKYKVTIWVRETTQANIAWKYLYF